MMMMMVMMMMMMSAMMFFYDNGGKDKCKDTVATDGVAIDGGHGNVR